MKTKLIILGCGNSLGTPRIDGHWGLCDKNNSKNYRTRCSAAIIRGSNIILIDTSPEIKFQLIRNKIKLVSSVVYTHEHSDQTSGIFELRPFAFKKMKNNKIKYWGKSKPINVYGNSKTMNLIKKRYDYCFRKIDVYPAIVKSHSIKKNFTLGKVNEKVKFKTFQAKHGNVYVTGYVFEKTAYLSDCSDLSIVEEKSLKNLNYLVIDCLNLSGGFAHFGLNDCLFINNALKPKKMILTNIHYNMDYKKFSSVLPSNITIAYDGLKLSL